MYNPIMVILFQLLNQSQFFSVVSKRFQDALQFKIGMRRRITRSNQSLIFGNRRINDGIGKNAVILARSGVANDVEENQIVFGTPAKDRRVAWREISSVSKVPELMKRITILEKKLVKLAGSPDS